MTPDSHSTWTEGWGSVRSLDLMIDQPMGADGNFSCRIRGRVPTGSELGSRTRPLVPSAPSPVRGLLRPVSV